MKPLEQTQCGLRLFVWQDTCRAIEPISRVQWLSGERGEGRQFTCPWRWQPWAAI